MSKPLTISLQNQTLHLHPTGGLFWEEQSMLLISDVHLGKVAHFRKFGAAVPTKAIHQNFKLLEQLVSDFEPFQICFMGDLFHSSLNQEWELFENWVARTPATFSLIKGNHDIIAPERFEKLEIPIYPTLEIGPLFLTHEPQEKQGTFNICGHIHPAIRMKGFGRQYLKLPCFFKTKNQMILPAFGQFTGTHVLTPKKEDEVFVIVENEVISV